MKNALKRFLTDWGRDVGIVMAGSALGLVVLFVIWDEPDRPPAIGQRNLPVPIERSAPQYPVSPPTAPRPAAKARESVPRILKPAATMKPDERAEKEPDWRRFAVTHSPIMDRHMIAVIIDDLGLDHTRTAKAMALSGPLILSFLTYARNLRAQTAIARSSGHELMVHLPMEPDDSDAYAGPKMIKRDLSGDEIRRRLDWALSRFEGYVGVNNHMGSRYTAYRPGMMLVMEEINRRGLMFIDSKTSRNSVAPAVARELSMPFAQRHIFLDDSPKAGDIAAQLKSLETLARSQGFAIAIGHPYDTTLSELKKWLPTLAPRGFILVPASAIVRRRLEAG